MIGAISNTRRVFPMLVLSAAAAFTIDYSHSANFMNKQSCTLLEKGKNYGPIHSDCLIRGSMAQGEMAGFIELPDGRKFSFFSHNDRNLFNNKKNRAKKSNCFEDDKVSICLDR